MSPKERRKNFNPRKWAKKYLKADPLSIRVIGGFGETKLAKIMSNEDRRKMGLEQDSALPDYKETNGVAEEYTIEKDGN